jgi:excisionase family DNA binding protein
MTDVGQVRGVIAERVVISSALDPFLSLKNAAKYTSLGERTLRSYVDLPPDEALPCYRLPGKILLRRSELDAWLEQFRSRGRPSLVRAMAVMGLGPRTIRRTTTA